MEKQIVALFGEAEKGEYSVPYYLRSVEELADRLGQPPADSRGLYLAVQALLFDRQLFFIRVEEEGYSTNDYLRGFDRLRQQGLSRLAALCLPGVGCKEIIGASSRLGLIDQCLLLISESDLYDYLTFGGG